jgi:hypothetical protein
MGTLFAMTLPFLIVLLIVLAVLDTIQTRLRNKRAAETGQPATNKPKAAMVAIDGLGLAFNPGSRHKKEHDTYMELDRETPGEGAPPRTRIDLDKGTAHIVLPKTGTGNESEPS